MVGSKVNLLVGWKLLRQDLHIELEQRVDDKGAVYLGCRHVVSFMKVPHAEMATTMTCDMEDFLKSRVTRYLGRVGLGVKLRNYSTPFSLKTIGSHLRVLPGSGQ